MTPEDPICAHCGEQCCDCYRPEGWVEEADWRRWEEADLFTTGNARPPEGDDEPF